LGTPQPDTFQVYGIFIIGVKTTGVKVAARTPVPRRMQRFRRSRTDSADLRFGRPESQLHRGRQGAAHRAVRRQR
jgi:hypothetical protein